MDSQRYSGMIDVMKRMTAKEGISSFFKGIGPPLISVLAYQSVCFASFNAALRSERIWLYLITPAFCVI